MQPWQNPRLDEIRGEIKTWAEQAFPGGPGRGLAGGFFTVQMVRGPGARDLSGTCGDVRGSLPALSHIGASQTKRNTIARMAGGAVEWAG